MILSRITLNLKNTYLICMMHLFVLEIYKKLI